MRFTIRNETLAKVEDQASFLEYLIEEYPRLLKDWTDKLDKEFQQQAEIIVDGEREIYASVYSSLTTAFDEIDYREDLFYKSMLIISYSYYEGAVKFLSKKAGTKNLIEAICKSNNFELSEEAKNALEAINSDTRIIRNQLVHNNMGNPQHTDDLLRISKRWNNIIFSNDEINICGSDFILDSLHKELLVLKELCKKLGYIHHIVNTGDSSKK